MALPGAHLFSSHLQIEIGHDNSGAMPGWHCAKVIVEDQTAKTRYAYPCDR